MTSELQVASDHENLVHCDDPSTGLKAIIAIHDTTLGPALGGLRMWPYATAQDALVDVLRLSRGMTYKAAVAGLNLGGGKSVIIGNPATDKTRALFQSFGRYVESLNGRYIVAEDVGTSVADLLVVRSETRHAVGLPGGSGDPSPATAFGVYQGIKAAVSHALGQDHLAGIRVAVQGLGHVGQVLCDFLAKDGARLVVADIDPERVKAVVDRHGATSLPTSAIHMAEVDVFAPCALGGGLNDDSIPALRARIVAGSANNQLGNDRHGTLLRDHGILYAPDYVINAGGLINVSYELTGYDPKVALAHVAKIGQTLSELFRRADLAGVSTNFIADGMAEERLAKARLDKSGPLRLAS